MMIFACIISVQGCSVLKFLGTETGDPDLFHGARIGESDLSVDKYEMKDSRSLHIAPTKQGIFSEDGQILIKTRGKSFLSVLDEVARLRRFNFTVLTDISKFYADYFDLDASTVKTIKPGRDSSNRAIWEDIIKQQRFDSIDDFVLTSVTTIKETYRNSDDPELKRLANKLRYKCTGDGFVFYSEDDINPAESTSGSFNADVKGYKKIFLFNLSEREVSFYVSRLLNIPYAPFSPNRGADLPRRESSPIQAVGGDSQAAQNASAANKAGEELQRIKPDEWQLSSQTTIDLSPPQNQNDLTGPVDGAENDRKKRELRLKQDLSEVRWVSIPQQNALIIRGNYSQLDKISEMLHAIDSDYKQIIIEAKVFQYSVATAKKIGLSLGSIPGKLDITQTTGNAVLTIAKTFGADVANALPANLFELSPTERRFALLSALTLYGADSVVRITADPRILLKPGQVSTLDITTTKLVQPPAPSTNNALSTIQAVQAVQVVAGVFFTVRPTLLSDNKIQLDLFLRQSDFSPSNEKNVLMAVAQNQIQTSIVASNGELISLGGQETKKYSLGNSGVPEFKDVGIIGNIFGTTEEDANTTRVEFMIRPQVYLVEDQLAAPIKSVEELNARINRLIKERWGNSSQ